MKIKKLKRMVIASILAILLFVPANAITLKEIEDNTVKKCDTLYRGSDAYYCVLSQFYALSRLHSLYTNESSGMINGLIEEYWDSEFETTDFVMVLRDVEEYIDATKDLDLREPGQR
jgi:hypothetical protein